MNGPARDAQLVCVGCGYRSTGSIDDSGPHGAQRMCDRCGQRISQLTGIPFHRDSAQRPSARQRQAANVRTAADAAELYGVGEPAPVDGMEHIGWTWEYDDGSYACILPDEYVGHRSQPEAMRPLYAAAPSSRPGAADLCQSRSRFGRCSLPAMHSGAVHAVAIGDGVYFGYTSHPTTPLGYGTLAADGFRPTLEPPQLEHAAADAT